MNIWLTDYKFESSLKDYNDDDHKDDDDVDVEDDDCIGEYFVTV